MSWQKKDWFSNKKITVQRTDTTLPQRPVETGARLCMAILSKCTSILAAGGPDSFIVEVNNWSVGGGQCHAQNSRCWCQQIASCDPKLKVRHPTALDRFDRSLYLGLNHHEALRVDSSDPPHHRSADDG